MLRAIIPLLVSLALLMGCSARGPIAPEINDSPTVSLQEGQSSYDGPYRLWGEWTFYIDETHTKIDVVPQRNGRFHLNTLKFLEEYCADCLEITGIHNNGDGTIDVMVQITHPFPGLREYTGFDVKGVIMFEGSREFNFNPKSSPVYPEDFRVSSRLLGDPELLNADGYTCRWSPWFDSGSSMPIFNYWPGKYSSGTPTANVNGYKNFYSNENRHMFECDAKVSRTYHISLPPGPLVVGYAVEACWEPPLVTPVLNPAEDFPITANQPEAYHFNIVVNDGEPVTDWNCCNVEDDWPDWSVHEARIEMDIWHLPLPPDNFIGSYRVTICGDQLSWDGCPTGVPLTGPTISYDDHCDGPENWWCLFGGPFLQYNAAGTYQCLAYERLSTSDIVDPPYKYTSIDLFEIVIEK